MATIYRDPGKTIWYARFFDAEGKRRSRSTGTDRKRDARAKAEEFEARERAKRRGEPHLPKAFAAVVENAAREAAAGDLTLARAETLIRRLHQIANPDFREVTLAEHLDHWIASQRPHVSAGTAATYADMKRRFTAALGPKVSNSSVDALTKEDVEKALGKITSTKIKSTTRHITAATANMDLRALRRALRTAVEQGLARNNVAENVRPLPEKDSSERAPFTAEEVRKLIDAAPSDEWRGLILIAAHTGLRMGDITGLTRQHLDEQRLVIRPGKTKRTRKTLSVPLTPPCLAWIGERKGAFFPTLGTTKSGTLSTQFTRIMARTGVARDITEAGDVTKRRSFHSLRHSFTSWLAEADIHADVRQRLTGHSSASVHARYTHHDEALDRAIEALPNF